MDLVVSLERDWKGKGSNLADPLGLQLKFLGPKLKMFLISCFENPSMDF